MNRDYLETLKRPELQRIAKKHGIKANLRNAKLVEEISLKLKELHCDGLQNQSPVCNISTKKSLSPNLDNIKDEITSLDAISPPWKDADSSLDDSTKPSPLQTRQSKTRSGSSGCTTEPQSRRTSKRSKTPDVSTSQQKHTPTTRSKQINTHTFSVPKNRTCSKTDSVKKSTKPALKRKSSVSIQKPSSAKRSRASSRASSSLKEQVVKGTEKKKELKPVADEKAGSAFGLPVFDKKFPAFAAQGVTIPTSLPALSGKMFEKTHKKNFKKMESIDDYQRRKEQRAEKLLGSSKKQERLNILSRPKTPTIAKPVSRPKPSFLSPKPKHTTTSRKTLKKPATFKPTVTKVTDINTQFASKRSKLATPKKVTVSFAKSPVKKSVNIVTPARSKKTSLPQSRKSSTPFRQNTSVVNTPQSNKKSVFNLQESLKKPLSWKPHKGPLKKFEEAEKKMTLKERSKAMKQPKVTTRETRRQKLQEAREASKSDRLMKRRGIK